MGSGRRAFGTCTFSLAGSNPLSRKSHPPAFISYQDITRHSVILIIPFDPLTLQITFIILLKAKTNTIVLVVPVREHGLLVILIVKPHVIIHVYIVPIFVLLKVIICLAWQNKKSRQ